MTDVGDVLQSLRVQGAARFDPVRFRFIEALAGRAASRQGEARRLLDSKLDAALEDYRTRFEQASAVAAGDLALAIKDHPDAADELSRCHHEGDFRRLKHALVRLRAGQGARVFGELLDQLRQVPREALPGAGRDVGAEVHELSDELRSVACFRDAWLKLSVNQQLSSALAQAPDNAGPLNSHILALQSLELMRDTSPEYLQHFMSYVDGLLWLEQADSGSRPAPKVAKVRGERDKGRKPGRARPG